MIQDSITLGEEQLLALPGGTGEPWRATEVMRLQLWGHHF